MNQDNSGDTHETPDDQGRDVLGELIQVAGRRPSPSASHYEQTFAATHAIWQRKVRATRQRQRVFAVAASIAILAIGIGAILRFAPDTPLPPIASAVIVQGDVAVFSPATGTWAPVTEPGFGLGAGDRLRTESDGRAAFTLGDAISVRLDSASDLMFTSESELELIAGIVYIDSGPGDQAGTVEIETAHGVLQDIGTQFEVATMTDNLRVRVREGLVKLFQAEQVLAFEGKAGEEFSVDPSGTIRQISFSPYDPAWSWAEALAASPDVEGMPVLEFLNWVARETGREIQFDGRNVQLAAGSAILHGSAQSLTPMEALEVMLATTNFVYSLDTSGTIIISRRSISR
ncbi:MAG: FecR domain-containing protein [Gammaproteobacteria bacterium]